MKDVPPMTLAWLKRGLRDNAREIAMIADELSKGTSPMEEWYQTRLIYLEKETAEIIRMIKDHTLVGADLSE